MEQERKIGVQKEAQIAWTLGNLIENNVLDRRETRKPVPEELRLVMRKGLIEKGIEVNRLVGDNKSENEIAKGISLKEAEYKNVNVGAAILVDAVLGQDKTDRMLELALDEVWKQKDHPEFETREVMVGYVMGVMKQLREKGSGFKFDVVKLSEGDEAKKTAVYRLEAIMHCAYKILRVASVESAEGAAKYQKDRFEKFRQRIIKGEIRKTGRQNATPRSLEMEDTSDDGKKIRHLSPGVLGAILEGMMV